MMRFEITELLGLFALGTIVAAAYLGALEWNIRLYCRSSPRLAFVFHALRLSGMAAVLVLIVRAAGAAALLASIGGFEAVRLLLVGAKALRAEDIR
jgi:hypothetical protein